jgi:heat shock protein HslJ
MNKSMLVATALMATMIAGVSACQPTAEPTADPGAGAETAAPATEAATEAPEPTAATMTDSGLSGSWTLVSMGDPASPTAVPEGLEVTANFTDGTVSGTSACNSYNAPFTVEGETLTVGQGVSTMMACEDPAMTLEQEYMAALQSVTGFSMDDDGLTLMYGDGMEMVFAPALTGGLAGTSWDVMNFNNGMEAVVGLVPDSAITLMFTTDSVNGAACNNYMGSFTEDDDSITIGPLAGTRMMCPGEGVMEQEQMYLAALEAATTWTVDGGTLTLRDDADAMQVVATAAEPATE